MQEIRRSPVEVGSVYPILYRVLYIPGGDRRISSINSRDETFLKDEATTPGMNLPTVKQACTAGPQRSWKYMDVSKIVVPPNHLFW